MKTLLCACALLCAFNLKAASVPSIVVVDMEAIIAHHPNTPNDKKLLEDTLAEFSQERDALRAAIKAKQADLEKQVQEAQNPMLAPAKADELRKACEAKFREIQRDTDAAEQKMASRSRELSDLEDRLLKRTTKEIQAHIAAYAKEKGFQVVLYKNMVPYVTPERDITDLIIVLCGGRPEPKDSSKGADELKPAATLEDSLPTK